MNFSPLDPIKALFWSAVINGVASAPIMVLMMLMASRADVMGEVPVSGVPSLAGLAINRGDGRRGDFHVLVDGGRARLLGPAFGCDRRAISKPHRRRPRVKEERGPGSVFTPVASRDFIDDGRSRRRARGGGSDE